MKTKMFLAAAVILSLAALPASAADQAGPAPAGDSAQPSAQTSSMIPDYQENQNAFYNTADYVPLRSSTIALPGLKVPSHPPMVGASVQFYLDRSSIRPAGADRPGQITMNVVGSIRLMVNPRYNGLSLYRVRLVMSYDSIDPSMVTVTAYPLINAIDTQGQIQYKPVSSTTVQRLEHDLFTDKAAAYAAAYAYQQVFGKALPAQADYTFHTGQ